MGSFDHDRTPGLVNPQAFHLDAPTYLAVFDLDGTLLASLEQSLPSLRVQSAIRQAQATGVGVTIASGRMFRSLRPIALDLGLQLPLICHQGAWIQAPDAARPLLRRTLAPHLAATALDLAETQGWHVMVYAGEWLYLRSLKFAEAFYRDLLGEFKIVQDWEPVLQTQGVDKVLCVAEEAHIPRLMEQFTARMQGQARVVRSHRYLMEVVPQGVSKGEAVAWLAQSLGVARERVLAVGDQENDLEMLHWAGTGVAMGNAPANVKAAADWVAPPVEEDGAAVALESWLRGLL